MQLTGDNLACSRGGREVFADITFSLSSGEALLVTGRNGAGKSSLLRVIAGLVRLAAGRLTLEGGEADASIGEQVALSRPPGRGEAVAVGARKSGILDALSRRLAAARSSPRWRRSTSPPLADLPAAYLSAGQRRRLSIARLVAVKRPLWLLDEPTSALDAPSQQRLADLMRAHLAVRRHDRRRGARADRARARARTEAGVGMNAPSMETRVNALLALIARDMRLAVRVGGGALMGALFFLIVVVMMPFALGPDLNAAGAHRPGDPVARRAAGEPARARPAVRDRLRRRLARSADDGPDAARTGGGGEGNRALADHRAAAGGDRAGARPDAQHRIARHGHAGADACSPARRRSPSSA